MTPRVRALAGLVAVLLVAHLLLILTARGPETVDPLVTRFDPVAIYRIELSRGERSVMLARSGEGWVVTSHGDVPAQPGSPDRLLELLRGWRRERVAGRDPARHAEWGVAAPAAHHVRLFGKSGAALVDLYVGKVTGIDRDALKDQGYNLDSAELGMFVRAEGDDEVVVVNAFVTTLLEPNPRNWFRRPLLEGSVQQVRRVTIEAPGRPALEVVAQPPPARVQSDPRPSDPAKVYGLLQQIYMLDALGGGVPRLGAATRFTVALPEGEVSFALWPEGQRWFLESDTLRVEVAAQLAYQLAHADADQLVRQRLTTFTMDNLGRMHWEEGGEELVIRLAKDLSWEVTRVRPGRTLAYARRPSGAAKRLRQGIEGLEVSRWDPEAASALEHPWAKLVLVDPVRRRRAEVTFGERRGAQRAVRIAGVDSPGWIADADAQAIRAAMMKLAPE